MLHIAPPIPEPDESVNSCAKRASKPAVGVEINDLWPSLLGHGLIAFGSIEHGVSLAYSHVAPQRPSSKFDRLPLSGRIDKIIELIEKSQAPQFDDLKAALTAAKPLLPLRNHIAHNPVMLDVFVFGTEFVTTQTIPSLQSGGRTMTFSDANVFVAEAKEVSLNIYAALARLTQLLQL